jgi:hypothetical protein
MADATRDDGTPQALPGRGQHVQRPDEVAPPRRAPIPPSSPALSASWLLRAAAFGAVAAGVMGVIVAPGVRGNASDGIVTGADRMSAALAYFLVGTLFALVLRGALELVHARGVPMVSRAALIVGGAAVVAMSLPGLSDRVSPPLAELIAAAAAMASLAGAFASARAPHTRAAAGVLFAFAFASIARLGAWELATRAGDAASLRLFGVSRGLATTAVLFEAAGQLVAVTWLGTRSRLTGHLGALVAVVSAAAITWGVARGVHSGAAPWQAVVHTALADAPGVPSPYGLDALATFLVPASLLLALVAAAQPNQVVAISATMALALVSRGAFDAPLRALCGVVAAQWAALSCIDERAMWRTLIEDRKKRLEEQ